MFVLLAYIRFVCSSVFFHFFVVWRTHKKLETRASSLDCADLILWSFLSSLSMARVEIGVGSLTGVVPFRLSGVARRHGSLSAYLLGAIC